MEQVAPPLLSTTTTPTTMAQDDLAKAAAAHLDPLSAGASLPGAPGTALNAAGLDAAGNSPLPPQVEPLMSAGTPTFENLHINVKQAMANTHIFDGAKFSFTKPLCETFQVGHIFEFTKPSNYTFSATHVDVEDGGQQPSAVYMANMDSNGGLLARISKYFGALQTTVMLQQVKDKMYTQLEAEYRGETFNSSLKIGEPDLVNESGVVIGNYLQSITDNLLLGGELRYQYEKGMENSVMTVGGHYRRADYNIYATIVPIAAAFNLSYMKKIHPTTNLFIDYEGALMSETKLSAGYETNFQAANIRGQIDSEGHVSAIMERKMGPGISFKLCGRLNHLTGEQVFGFGFFIGGP